MPRETTSGQGRSRVRRPESARIGRIDDVQLRDILAASRRSTASPPGARLEPPIPSSTTSDTASALISFAELRMRDRRPPSRCGNVSHPSQRFSSAPVQTEASPIPNSPDDSCRLTPHAACSRMESFSEETRRDRIQAWALTVEVPRSCSLFAEAFDSERHHSI